MASRSISQCNCAFASVNRRTTARPKVISCENVDTSNINSNYFNERVTEGGLPGYQKLLGREPAEQDRVAEYVFIATGLETWKIMRNLGKSWGTWSFGFVGFVGSKYTGILTIADFTQALLSPGPWQIMGIHVNFHVNPQF